MGLLLRVVSVAETREPAARHGWSGHQENSTGSIMSYAADRDVLYYDVKRLVDAYTPLVSQ